MRTIETLVIVVILFFANGCSKSEKVTVQEDFWIYMLWETASEYEIVVTSGVYRDNRFEGYAVTGTEKLDEDEIARFLFQREMFEGRDIDELTVRIEVKDREGQIIKRAELTYPFEEVYGKTLFIRFDEENDKPIIKVYELTELRQNQMKYGH